MKCKSCHVEKPESAYRPRTVTCIECCEKMKARYEAKKDVEYNPDINRLLRVWPRVTI